MEDGSARSHEKPGCIPDGEPSFIQSRELERIRKRISRGVGTDSPECEY